MAYGELSPRFFCSPGNREEVMLNSIPNGNLPTYPTLLLDYGSQATAAVLVLPEEDSSHWPTFEFAASIPMGQIRKALQEAKLPAPEQTLLCGMSETCGDTALSSTERRAQRMLRWKDALHHTEGHAEFFLQEELQGWEAAPLLRDAQQTFGTALGTDSGMAAILAALSLNSLRDRSWSEGVTVIWAGHCHIQAFMIYQERLLGLYEQHSSISVDSFLNDLRELRLNWLPDEQVRAAGGHGCICGDFPAEAEGFRPTWILGPRRADLEGYGRLVSPSGDDRFDRCLGLLFGISLRKTA